MKKLILVLILLAVCSLAYAKGSLLLFGLGGGAPTVVVPPGDTWAIEGTADCWLIEGTADCWLTE